MGALENENLAPEIAQPETAQPEISQPQEKRKRGRPSNAERAARGEGKQAEETVSKPKAKARGKGGLDEATLAQQLFGLHAMGAMLIGLPVMQITQDESALLAKSIILVMEEYDLALSGKTAASIQLLGVAAMIYAPRVMSVMAMKKASRAPQTVEGQATREPDTTSGRGE